MTDTDAIVKPAAVGRNRKSSPKLRVLLVEDHAATANALRRYLEQIGYAVHVAPDARCAREYAVTDKFDVLICDIGLPDGNGWNLMRNLRRRRDFVGIAISGFGSESDLERSSAAGFRLHLTKPFSPDDLTDALEHVAADGATARD